jgi:integrase
VGMRVVMELLGHSQMSITSDLYSHVAPEVAREAVSAIDAARWAE